MLRKWPCYFLVTRIFLRIAESFNLSSFFLFGLKNFGWKIIFSTRTWENYKTLEFLTSKQLYLFSQSGETLELEIFTVSQSYEIFWILFLEKKLKLYCGLTWCGDFCSPLRLDWEWWDKCSFYAFIGPCSLKLRSFWL